MPQAKPKFAITACALTLFTTACTHAPPPLLPEPQPWQSLGALTLTTADTVLPAAGLYLRERTANGSGQAILQLDFAGNGQWPFGLPESIAVRCDARPRISGLHAGMPANSWSIDFGDSRLPGTDTAGIGTLGLARVRYQTTIIDAARHRMLILRGADARAIDSTRIRWTRATVEDDRLFVMIDGNGTPARRALLDTGLLPVAALATPTAWQALTGRRIDAPGLRRLQLPGCGNTLTIVLAPLRQALLLGARTLAVRQVGVLLRDNAPIADGAWPGGAELMLSAEAWIGDDVTILQPSASRIGYALRK